MFCASGATTISAPTSWARLETTSVSWVMLDLRRRFALYSDRWFAAHRRTVQFATVALVVVVSLVHAQSVVPEREHVGLPAQTAREGVLSTVLGEGLQCRRRFYRQHAFYADAVGRIDVQGPLAGCRVRANHRMAVALELAHEVIREPLGVARGRQPTDRAVSHFDRFVH